MYYLPPSYQQTTQFNNQLNIRNQQQISFNQQQNFRFNPNYHHLYYNSRPQKKDILLYFNFIMDRGNAFTCMKYTLILCNVFGFILAIFNALFGIGYPQEKWPGGYTGGQMAIFSLFVMAFTTIGYCGAQHHKGYLLIVYGIIIFFLLIGLVAICFIYNDSLAELMYNGYMISFAVVIFFLMLFAFFISYKISEHGSSKYLSTIIPTSASLQQQHQQQQQQQHQQHQQQQQQNRRTNQPSTTVTSGNCMATTAAVDAANRRQHQPFTTSTSNTGSGGGSSSATAGNPTQQNTQQQNTTNQIQNTNPCPVPGCNYGKIISN